MGIFDRLLASNKVVTTYEEDKYPTLRGLPKCIAGYDWNTGKCSGFVCHEKHRWDRELRAWVCQHHTHHESRHTEVVGDYEAWKKKH